MNSLCSMCRSARAISLCVCISPLPLLCQFCEPKHKASPDFHYILPIASSDVVTAQNQRDWKIWLVSLNDAQQELIRSAEMMNKCKEEVITAYEEARRVLDQQKDCMLRALEDRKRAVDAAVRAAFWETSENCKDSNYHPTSECASLIWSRATKADSQPISLLIWHIHVSAERIKEAVTVGIEFKVIELEELKLNQEVLEVSFQPDSRAVLKINEPKSPLPTAKPGHFPIPKQFPTNPYPLRETKSVLDNEFARKRRDEELLQTDDWTCTSCHTKYPLSSTKCNQTR